MQVEGSIKTLNATSVSAHIPDGDAYQGDEFAAEINRVIKPPEAVRANEIIVRAALLISDQRNNYGGKFAIDELTHLRELVIDTPVLVGHRKDRLPVGRVFQAELVTVDNVNWLKVWFYWIKQAKTTDTLAVNIDGGIYKECSLGFTFSKAECSVCGDDARMCEHSSRVVAATDDPSSEPIFYYYRDIQRALEVSLVYRGANPDTRVGAELGIVELDIQGEDTDRRVAIEEYLENVVVSRRRTIAEVSLPNDASGITDALSEDNPSRILCGESSSLEGLPLFLGSFQGELFVRLEDLSEAPEELSESVCSLLSAPDGDLDDAFDGDYLLYARLVGMRGKQRRSVTELLQRLSEGRGPVRSLKLRAIALLQSEQSEQSEQAALSQLISKSRGLSVAPSVPSDSGSDQWERVFKDRSGAFTIERQVSEPLFVAEFAVDGSLRAVVNDTDVHFTIPKMKFSGSSELGEKMALIRCDKFVSRGGAITIVNPRVVEWYGRCAIAENTVTLESLSNKHEQMVVVERESAVTLRYAGGCGEFCDGRRTLIYRGRKLTAQIVNTEIVRSEIVR